MHTGSATAPYGSGAMTAILIRHGETDSIGRYLSGRRRDHHLTETGRQQAERLPSRLSRHPLAALYTSPLERARETADPLARVRHLTPRTDDDLLEVDFGEWTGKTFAELDATPAWHEYNNHRATASAPGGESIPHLQKRAVAAIERLRRVHETAAIAVVSHAEVIRCAVLHYLGMPLDMFRRIEISPASITILELGPDDCRFLCINAQDPA
jgi:probable phosphoglycerate mutase